MRLDRYLSKAGLGSRNDVKKMIKRGLVCVNGMMEKNSATHISIDRDKISVEDKLIEYKPFVYIMLNKPSGYISARTDREKLTVLDLIDGYHQYELFPMGRLDIDTEGLLILTNDGKLSHRILSPKRHVPKKYLVYLDDRLNDKDIHLLETGVTLDDGYTCKPAELSNLMVASPYDELSEGGYAQSVQISITEGKYHQIKRMFMAVGKKVLYLKRLSMGDLELDTTLTLGEYRELDEYEVKLLEQKGGEDA